MKEFTNRPPKKSDKQGDRLRVNHEIRCPEVRVIDEEGKMLGLFHPNDAVRMAQDRGLDLIEVAPLAKPPTCKIMDFGKWKYENKKKAQVAKKKQVIVDIKEIQLRPRTDDHDLNTKLKHARRFILDGDKVKVNLRFMGRELAHQDMGAMILTRFTEGLIDISALESAPFREGKQMFALFAPDQTKIKEYLKANPQMTPAARPVVEESGEEEVQETAEN